MRAATLAVLLAAACGGDILPLPMAQTLTIRARGLYLTPNDLGAVPDGALAVADNMVLSKEGILEPRRGLPVIATIAGKTIDAFFPYRDRLIAHATDGTLYYSSTDYLTWTPYTGTWLGPSGIRMRGAEANGNVYFTGSDGVKRLDAVTGTPEAAGMPQGLEVQAVLAAGGTAIPANTQVAYRVVWAKKDANGNLLLGSPSGRGVLLNPSAGAAKDVTVSTTIPHDVNSSHYFQAYRSNTSVSDAVEPDDELGLVYEGPAPQPQALTQLSRTTNVVTATTGSAHGYAVGEIVRLPTTVGGGSTLFAAVGYSSACATSPDGTTWTGRTITAGEYHAAAYAAGVFVAVGTLAACSTSPDGITWTGRTIPAGNYYGLAWNGSIFVAVGYSAASSPDGITWTARSIPGPGTYLSVAWNGSVFVAVGTSSTCATSPDGITWTARTIPSGYSAVTWGGSTFVAVGTNVAATSPDGITWTARTIPTGTWDGVAWNGSVFAAIGQGSAAATSPDGVTWTTRTIPAGDYAGLVWSGSIFVAVGSNVAATSADGITWTARTIPAGLYTAVGAKLGLIFQAGEYTIASIPLSTTFTYADTGGDGTVSTTQTVTPLTAVFTDSVPSAFIGAALYTNPSQEGILNGNSAVAGAVDVALFRGSLFYLGPKLYSAVDIYLLSVGGTAGIAAGDTITIDGLAYTADATTESISLRKFKLATSGTVSQNIRDTAASLIRIINRTLSNTIMARDVSDANGIPGHIYVRELTGSTTLTVSVSGHAPAWSIGTVQANETIANGLVWSKSNQPDAIPTAIALVPARVGNRVDSARRILATRNALWILKDEGVWVLTGDAGNWRIDQFDPTTHILAPDSAVVLDNQVFALTEQGVQRVSDTGVTVISRDIEVALWPLLNPATRATTVSTAFGVGYEQDHKYLLWLPSAAGDAKAQQAYVYDLFANDGQGAWTRWPVAANFGLLNKTDNRLYLSNGASIIQERKTFTSFDHGDNDVAITINSVGVNTLVLADASGVLVGDAIVQAGSPDPYPGTVILVNGNTVTLGRTASFSAGAAVATHAISTAVQWTPRFGNQPGALHHFREVDLLFRSVYYAQSTISYSTNLSPAWESITLLGSDQGWTGAQVAQAAVRTLVPQEKARASQLNVKWQHAQAFSPFQLQALSVVYSPGSTRINR